MRVIYRSASKRRLAQSTASFTQEAWTRFRFSWQRLGSCRDTLYRFIVCCLSWVLLSVFLVAGAGPFCAAYMLWRRRAVPRICRQYLEPGNDLESLTTIRDHEGSLDHLLIKLQGQPCIEKIREQVAGLVELHRTEKDGWKLKQRLVRLPFGCWAWKSLDNAFNVKKHVTLCADVWRGAPLNEHSLKYKVNELCGVCLDSGSCPWHIHVVPFIQTDTRSACHALLIRAHTLISHHFRVEDFYSCNAEEKFLRNAVADVLLQTPSFVEDDEDLPTALNKGISTELQAGNYDHTLTTLGFIWKAPALLFHEILCSLRSASSWMVSSKHKKRRALCWSNPIPKELLNRLIKASGAGSLDSVLLSCLAGSLHHYRQVSTNLDVDVDDVRSLISWENGYVCLNLNAGDSCPKARIRRVQRSLLRGLASSKYHLSRLLVSSWFKVFPRWFVCFFGSLLAQRYPVLVDNLQIPVSNASVMEAYQWNMPQVEVGILLTFVHYGDHVSLSVISDFETLQRPDLLMSCFGRAVVDLALSLDVRCERRPSPPSTPTSLSGRCF